MPDGAPLPPDVERDDIDEAGDRSIEAIAQRLYRSMGGTRFDLVGWRYDFESALARELAPVRRVRDKVGRIWFEFAGHWHDSAGTDSPRLMVDAEDIDFAYVGKPAEAKPLDVKAIAAELYASLHQCGEDRYEAHMPWSLRQRFEAAITRLMCAAPEVPKALAAMEAGDICEDCALTGVPGGLCPTHAQYRKFPQTISDLLSTAWQIAAERHAQAAQKRDRQQMRAYMDLLDKLGDAMDMEAIKDSEIPF